MSIQIKTKQLAKLKCYANEEHQKYEKHHNSIVMLKTKDHTNLRMTVAKKSIAKYFKTERARILQYIEIVHVDGRQPVEFSAIELASIDADILLFLFDASNRISHLDPRTPSGSVQTLRRAITSLRQAYNDPIRPEDSQFATGGTSADIQALLTYEWGCITPRNGFPTVSSTTNPP